MSHTHKANKRAVSRRHHAHTSSRRSSPHVIPTQSRAYTPTKGATASTPPTTTPAPDVPTRQYRQDHHDQRAHPDQAALKERAFSLSCIGLRSPAIAARLGVSQRTIRHWNYTTMRALALDATGLSPDLDAPADADPPGATALTGPDVPLDAVAEAAASAPDTYRLEYHRALAIERQLEIAVIARAAYDRLMAQHDHLLAQYVATCDANLAATAAVATTAATASADEASLPPLPAAVASMARLIPQLASSASRQLQIAQAAHREVARLQGVPVYAQTDARLSAEYEAKQAQQAADPDEEQGGLVPIHFFDANAALDDICGPDDDEDGDDENETPTTVPAHNAPSDSAAKTANDPGNNSGNISGNISGNGTSHTTLAT